MMLKLSKVMLMKTVDTYGTFEDILTTSTPAAQDIAHRLRALIIDVYPNVVEVPWPTQRVAGYGVGPKKSTEHFCYISASKNHVNLGFNYGAEVPDPEGLLEGTGTMFRHTKIKQLAEVERPALRHLLEAASKHRMPTHPSS